MPRYRKLPVEIEAQQFIDDKEGRSLTEIIEWISDNGGICATDGPIRVTNRIMIKTLEGTMAVSPRDYVIKGVKGEFYPCRPDIFEATYERV